MVQVTQKQFDRMGSRPTKVLLAANET